MLIDHHRHHRLAMPELRRFLREARKAAGLKGGYSVCLTTDEEIRSMNEQFRGVDKATDVLSFPAGEEEADGFAVPGVPGRTGYLGDLAISVDTAALQAEELGHDLEQEVRILIVHGLLHLAGYDHETDRGEMREREDQVRGVLGLTPGLIARAESAGAALATRSLGPAKPARRRQPTRKTQ